MRAIVVLSFELDAPEDAALILGAIDPPSLPGFAGEVRIAVEPVASAVVAFLDAE